MAKLGSGAGRRPRAAAPLTIERLRRRALAASLFAPTRLSQAIAALGFVQADPIRAPARAQDLILRHRVLDYGAGDLERRFPHLALEEDFLYAYGFMPRRTLRLLHPRHDPESPDGRYGLSGLAAEVFAAVREGGLTHPQQLEAQFGRERAVNGWGGFSKATTRALHKLHYHGLLRVAGRRDGIRLYAATSAHPEPLAPEDRACRLVLLLTRILSPISDPTLGATFRLLRRGAPGMCGIRGAVDALLKSGALESGVVDGERYLWPASPDAMAHDVPREVRLLAPFDPVVWDRRRFEHFWGWAYRFEAYAPPAKRRLGYYAMPLLWGDRIIGWANVARSTDRLRVDAGFVGSAPRGRDFRRAFDAEIARMDAFLRRRDDI